MHVVEEKKNLQYLGVDRECLNAKNDKVIEIEIVQMKMK